MIAAQEDHWHGASHDTKMVHYAINIQAKTSWGKAVSNNDYAG